jgi:hypothetical protein
LSTPKPAKGAAQQDDGSPTGALDLVACPDFDVHFPLERVHFSLKRG